MKNKEVIGVIACGGKSTRMGVDKSLIKYFDKPQRYHLYELLLSICDDVVISCNRNQANSIDRKYKFVVDDDKYAGNGPVSGLLTCMEKYQGRAILYLGCDYPFVETPCMVSLQVNRKYGSTVTCFINNKNIPEPLITIYEPTSYNLLLNRFHNKQFSLREFLETTDANKIQPEDFQFLTSVDSYEEYLVTRSKLEA